MTEHTGAATRITEVVGSWDGVEVGPHRFGGVEFRHHVLPDTGWVTADLDSPGGVEQVIELFRLSYDRALGARAHRASAEARHA